MTNDPSSSSAHGVAFAANVSPGVRLGPYEVESLLGTGGMGSVFRARDTRLGRAVAIKVCNEQFTGRFTREALAISSLNHPNICTLFDVGPNYLVMELVPGETLAARLEKGLMEPDAIARLAQQIAAALEAAHAKGVIHRDLKPGNIMITKSGIKVLDFGLAKVETSEGAAASEASTVATSREVMGTLPYMAPEQFDGKQCDARTDIFALGLVMYEMATGKRAFSGNTPAELISEIVKCKPPFMESIADPLSLVVRNCLARDPDERWQTAREVQIALRAGVAVTQPVASVKRNRERWAWAAALVFGMALAALTAMRFFGPEVSPGRISFRVFPPDKGRFTTGFNPDEAAMAISPDGRRLAFVATVEGKALLWIQDLDQLVPRSLAGTEGAFSPFWSPDSKSVAFFTGTQLKKIDVDGGPPKVICATTTAARWGSWGSRGNIIFSVTQEPGGIFRVGADGGNAVRILGVDPSLNVGWLLWPQFFPDGNQFSYLVWERGSGNRVMVGSLQGGEPRFLMKESSLVVYVSPGLLLFAREGVLLAQRFNLKDLRLEGAPVPIVDQIQYFQATGQAAFSVSANGRLAYQPPGNSSRLLWLDRTGRETGSVLDAAAYQYPRLSPDNKKLVVSRFVPRFGTEDVYLVDLSNDTGTRLTSDPGDEFGPVFSPDGQRILFSWDNNAIPFLHELALNGNGSPKPFSQPSGSVQQALEWLPDGSILYQDVVPETDLDLMLLSPGEKRMPHKILATRFKEMNATISPNGRWMAYISDDTGDFQVYVRSFPQLDAPRRISANGGQNPRWAPNGRELYFIEGDRLVGVPVNTGGAFESGKPTVLFQHGAGIVDFDVAKDGRFLINSGHIGYTSAPIAVVVNWKDQLPK